VRYGGTEELTVTDSRLEEAKGLMKRFAARSGLVGGASTRYLWTDAFAVCNLLELERRDGGGFYLDLAERLVSDVHHRLGRHRPDEAREGRKGWLSGLDEREGEAHPTRGGLRIGKPLPERHLDEPFDERLEWERDGQYFHYLTKWMHALDQMTRTTGDWRFNLWARELARTAFDAFTYTPPNGGPRRMYWKMSIDLTRPLVPSMGLHDPLDGFVTFLQLEATVSLMPLPPPRPSLEEPIAELAAMVDTSVRATSDPLGLGGLLSDAARLAQLEDRLDRRGREILDAMLDSALTSLRLYNSRTLRFPASQRLAFRELGLSIGLQAIPILGKHRTRGGNVASTIDRLDGFRPLADDIESFWRDPQHQRSPPWAEHRDINDVMLATSLTPEGFLVLGRPPTPPMDHAP
jgi:hypothetical protein